MSVFGRLFSSKPPLAPARRPFATRDLGQSQAGEPREPGLRREPVLSPGQVFTPTQPKPGSRQLTGRQSELQRIMQALTDDRAHVVLYSERGRGKTSLSNMVIESLRRAETIVARHTCEAGSDFDSIMRGLMRDLPGSLLAGPVGTGVEGCEAALPDRPLRPGDVAALPARLACRGLVCLVDEFDRVEDTRTRTQLADAIKQLSDRDVPLLFLVVGVSENLDEILGQHPSIQRSVLGVHLPLFTDRDVAQLIAKGGRESGFAFLPPTVARIVVLSRGMPYMAQLLGLRLTQAAANRGETTVSEEDFDTAVARLVNDANPRILNMYASLTRRGTDMEVVSALRRIATAPQDAWGRLEVVPLGDGRVSVGGRRIGPCWSRLTESGALAPVTGNPDLYVFAERSLMHHILLLAANDIADTELGEAPERGIAVLRPMASNA